MSADVIGDPLLIPAPETQPLSAVILIAHTEVEYAACDCCGLTEECTPTYIERIRECYHGKWICGLCAEAIKDEIIRTGRLVGTEEAMARHASFCMQFKSPEKPPQDPAIHLISAMRQLLRRTLESRSTPSSPTRTDAGVAGPALARSESCFPSLAGVALGTNKVGEWAQLAHT